MTAELATVRRSSIPRAAALIALGLSLAACHAGADHAAAPPAPADHAVLRQRLLDADSQLAAAIERAGEAAGMTPWLARDAVYLHPGAPLVIGGAAVHDLLVRAFPDGAAHAPRLHRVAGDASADGQLGYSFGWLEPARPGDGTPGKYLATWQRGDHGWQLAAFARIASKAPPAAPPADAAILAGEHGVVRPGEPGALRDQAVAADAAFSALSVARGPAAAFAAYAAPDAVMVAGSELFWNAAGVDRAWADAAPGDGLVWTPTLGRAAASGDLAFTVGEATFHTAQGEASYSKYLTVWIRRADGSWRFLLDGGNARPAP